MRSKMSLISIRVPSELLTEARQLTDRKNENFKKAGSFGRVSQSEVIRNAIESGLLSLASELGPPKRKPKKAKRPTARRR